MTTNASWRDRVDTLKARIPDPLAPFPGDPANGVETRRRWANQRRRRSEILRSARQLVAEGGLDNVHMQAVADRSGVSIQTVYNVVGNRQEMLGTAASEWIVALARQAEAIGSESSVNETFSTIEMFWAGAILQRDYTVNLIREQAQCGLLERPFLLTTHRVLADQLRRLELGGQLVRWADISLMARQLATSSHACVREWLAAPYDEGRFRNTLVVGCGLLLRGAVRGAEVERVERALDG